MDVIVIDTPQLGDRSYVVHDGTVALVVDPQRDTDRIEAAAAAAGVRITHVAETHLHNDYVTGGFALARQLEVPYLLSAAEDVRYDRTPIRDGDQLGVGAMTVTVVSTPGHTEHHLAYLVRHAGQQAVFSGGSLLYGSVGRTDLVDPSLTETLTRAQYASVRRLVDAADHGDLYPTHGFGSFCSSGPATGAATSTVADQMVANHALTDHDEEHFVHELIAGLTAYPAYYAHMAAANADGPATPDLSVPEPLDPVELVRRLQQGEWVVDLRHRTAYAARHLRGTVSFEYGTGFTTYLGWLVPWGERITLVGERTQVRDAVRDLSRIGIDSPDAVLGQDPAVLAPDAPTASYPRAGWADLLRDRRDDDVVLDVRRTDEFATGHLAEAINVPLHELLPRIDEVPPGRVWVHCASGYRAGVAASLLQRSGREVVHLDAEVTDAVRSGLAVAT
ncbi:MAG: MBL fold metallo-hydrolase [Phycicoccus sp.]